ncbi:MAG TPA: RNA chaperone Hfq [Candidatus Limnocylindrales bacterium]|jgi:host factor-I protein|nr:RNA chaperone Hfq [Candidatus Limnocylindrales bacterium]
MNVTSIQESFFSAALARHKHVIVYLLSGAMVTGKVRSYDKYSVVLEEKDLEQLVFKHSISAAFLCRNKECKECEDGAPS